MANVTDYVRWRGDIGFDSAPWNEIDALALATLAYLDLPGADDPDGVLLKEVKGRVQPGKSDLDPARIALLEAMAASKRFADVRFHHFIDIFMEEEEVQFSAMCADVPDGSLCVAFRGTDSTLVGWKEDFNMCVLEPVPAQEAAAFYLEKAAEQTDRPIRVAGHSKGGNLSVFAAASADPGVADRVTDVYTFDGPGMCPQVFESEGYARMEDRIRSFVPRTAIVGLMMNHARKYTVVRSTAGGMAQHDSMTWEVYGPKFVTAEKVDEKAEMIRETLHEWLEQTDPDQREAFVDTAYRLIEETEATTVKELLGDKKKNFRAILGGARELDPAMRKTFVKLSGMVLALGADNLMERMPFLKKDRKDRGEHPADDQNIKTEGTGTMAYLSDIEIAQQCEMRPIQEIAARAHVDEKYLEQYGKYKAKVDPALLKETDRKPGKLVLVTAMTPTPAGEGKTTTTIGLADGLKRIGKDVVVALREPSLGPVFGIKGGAAGGGYAQVVPMEDINLHFTGDFHAIGAANNLLAAMLDNHIQQGNSLNIDPKRITWKRCVDMNDRQLRFVVDGLGGRINGTPREDGFDITVASEIMAVFCLASSITDLKERLGRIVVAYTYDEKPVTAADLKATGAMAALLKDAIKPNLVQTLEGTPAFVHGGPFANIAHGCNSVMATRMAMRMGDYTVTEAGFGADLGAEKFLDIKCRMTGLKPDAVVVVGTVRALKMHGGLDKKSLNQENLEALEKGLPNLLRHVHNMKEVYKLPCVVAINRFPTDTDAEIDMVIRKCRELGANTVLSTVWAEGGKGGEELAKEVVRLCETENNFTFSYNAEDTIEKKLNDIVKNVYGGAGAVLTPQAKKQAEQLTALGYGNMPICVAKTQYSFSDDPAKLGAPEGFTVTVRNLKVSAGAGFLVALTGEIMTMPGLPKSPAAERIDVDENGVISGLF